MSENNAPFTPTDTSERPVSDAIKRVLSDQGIIEALFTIIVFAAMIAGGIFFIGLAFVAIVALWQALGL